MADGKVRIQIETNAGKATNELKGFDKAVKDTKKDGKELVDSNNMLQGSMNKLANAAKGLVGAYIGLQGVKVVTGYVLDSVEAFRTQERAIIGMDTALMNAGVYTAEYSQHLQELASSIQSYSNYGDEAIEKAIGLGQAFAGQTKFTDELIKATVDFAAAMDMDLDSAFNLVGKSIGTSTNALGRYGVELKKGMTDSQKMQAIVEQLGARYDGQAKNMANASVQLKNAMGDLSEQLGGVFNPMVTATTNLLIKATQALTGWIQRAREAANQKDIAALNKSLVYQQEQLGKARTEAERKEWEARIAQTKKYLNYQENLLKPSKISATAPQIKPIKFNDGLDSATTSHKNKVKEIKTAYEQLQDSVEKARMSVLNAATIYGPASTQVQSAMTKFSEASQKLANVNDVLKEQAQQGGAYEQLNKRLQELKQSLLDLGASGGIGSEQFTKIKNEYLTTAEEIKKINDSLNEEMGKGWENFGKDVDSVIKNSFVNSIRQGASAWEVMGNVAISVMNRIIDKILEEIALTEVLNSVKAAGSSFGGWFGKLFPHAKGGAFENGVQKFATGGVVNKPTTFAMAGGKTGLMGEAGAEAIMPLKRTSNGDLGIQATQPQINIYNQSGAQIETVERPDGDIDLFIKKVNNALANERTQQGFSRALQRNDTKGLQAS